MQEKLRKIERPTPAEFWDSKELRQFKLYYPDKSEFKKIRSWLRSKANKFTEKDRTILQIAEKKYGQIDDFSDYKKTRTTKLVNAIYNYTPSYFMDKSEKVYFKSEPFGRFFYFYIYYLCF